jgi:hypothetical protein
MLVHHRGVISDSTAQPPTAEELRARRARYQIPLYILAAHPFLRVHPIRLGRMLGGRVGLPPDLADRIASAISEIAQREAR